MMPLGLLAADEEGIVQRIAGKPEVRKHLENLGFVAGDTVRVISEQNGNIIVKVKESRIAISKEMAMIIYV